MKLEPNKEAEHGEEKKSNIFEKKTNQKWKNEMRKKRDDQHNRFHRITIVRR